MRFVGKNKNYKDDDGNHFNIGLLFTRERANGSIKFYVEIIYGGFDNAKVPKGDKILIRTGNGNMYEGETQQSVKSELTIKESYLIGGDRKKDIQFTDMIALYHLPYKAAKDIAESGIIKVRLHANTTQPIDHNFSAKKYTKISNKVASLSYYLNQLITNNNIWTEYLNHNFDNPSSVPDF